MRNSFTFCALIFAVAIIPHNPALAGFITTVDTIVVSGTVTQTVETKTATGHATITPPGGPPSTLIMPAGGGKITEVVPLAAFASATVNLATQSKSHAWGYVSDSGFTADSSADIHKMRTVTSTTNSQIITHTTITKDPNEKDSVYFAPNAHGAINYVTTLTDNNTGTLLFNSTTNFTDASANVVHDSTGLLTWIRTPGFFGGDEGNVFGLPNLFSNNEWVLAPFSLTFDITTNLAAGASYTQDITAFDGSSGTGTGGVIGVSSLTIPEPSSLTLLGLGCLALVGFRARRGRPS